MLAVQSCATYNLELPYQHQTWPWRRYLLLRLPCLSISLVAREPFGSKVAVGLASSAEDGGRGVIAGCQLKMKPGYAELSYLLATASIW